MSEMDELMASCRVMVKGGVENAYGKVNVLLQTYVSCIPVESFSLTSDLSYVAQVSVCLSICVHWTVITRRSPSSPPPQNAGRILRGLFEIALRRGQPSLSAKLLVLCKCVDHRQWMFDHPLRQFSRERHLTALAKLEESKLTIDRLRDMTADEIGKVGVAAWRRSFVFGTAVCFQEEFICFVLLCQVT